jgi:hypothetical protein
MKTVFLLALLIGFAGTLAGAHFAPGLKHARLPSNTTVVSNGGRAEKFMIRLPADRIAATDGEAGGLRAKGADGVMMMPAQFVAEPLLIEHFKVRDSGGAVIGVAARHWNGTGAEATTTWSVLIPSRGALVLSSRGETRALDSALRRAAIARARLAGSITLPMTGDGDGVVAAGTGEFENLLGTYRETWSVAAVDQDGKVSGTIELSTVTSRLQ